MGARRQKSAPSRLEIVALVFLALALAVDLLKGALTREMLPGANVAELSLERLSLSVSQIPLTKLRELRPVELPHLLGLGAHRIGIAHQSFRSPMRVKP